MSHDISFEYFIGDCYSIVLPRRQDLLPIQLLRPNAMYDLWAINYLLTRTYYTYFTLHDTTRHGDYINEACTGLTIDIVHMTF